MSAHRTAGARTPLRQTAGSFTPKPAAAARVGWPPAAVWKTYATHILIPLFMLAGMSLAYLGAFHQPQPHHLEVAVVGKGAPAEVFAQKLNDKSGEKLNVRTVPTASDAGRLVREQKIAAAYQPGAKHATLIVATAASDTTASAVQRIFTPIAYSQQLPLKVDDVVPVRAHDTSGQGLFFLLVALSVGGYASAVVVAGVTGRVNPGWRTGLCAVTAGVFSGIALIVAGPIFQIVDTNTWKIWLMSWLYVFGIVTIGVGLHPVLGKWTTPILALLFVMLNFTSSGGVFTPAFQPELFAGLNTFWDGAAWLNASQALLYFPGRTFGMEGLRLAIWAGVGLMLISLTHLWTIRTQRLADDTRSVSAQEEEEIVAA